MLLVTLLHVTGLSTVADFSSDSDGLAVVDIYDVPIVPAAEVIGSLHAVAGLTPSCKRSCFCWRSYCVGGPLLLLSFMLFSLVLWSWYCRHPCLLPESLLLLVSLYIIFSIIQTSVLLHGVPGVGVPTIAFVFCSCCFWELFRYVANQENGKRPLFTGAIRLLANQR
jgi:hypothetical protein